MFDVGSKLFWLLSTAVVFICKQIMNISSMLSSELLPHNRTVKQVIVAPNGDCPSSHISCIACCMFSLTCWGVSQSRGKNPSAWRADGVNRSQWRREVHIWFTMMIWWWEVGFVWYVWSMLKMLSHTKPVRFIKKPYNASLLFATYECDIQFTDDNIMIADARNHFFHRVLIWNVRSH